MPVHLFHGVDRFAKLEAVTALRLAHDADGALANNSSSFDGARVSFGELGAAISASPFLGGVRWVRVDGLCGRFAAPRRGGARLGEWDGLGQLLTQAPDTTVLVFVEDELRQTNPILQQIAPQADVREFKRFSTDEALEWLRGEVRQRGLQLTRNAARTLVDRSDGDRGTLAQAVEKLSLYAGEASVDESIVELMSPDQRSVTIFNLVDAVAERRLVDAMQALDTFRASQDYRDEQGIIQMLARTYRQVAAVREIVDRGGSDADIQESVGVRFDWLARRLRRQAQRYTQETADAALARILEAEVDVIDFRRGEGGLSEDVAVELLVAELAGAAR